MAHLGHAGVIFHSFEGVGNNRDEIIFSNRFGGLSIRAVGSFEKIPVF